MRPCRRAISAQSTCVASCSDRPWRSLPQRHSLFGIIQQQSYRWSGRSPAPLDFPCCKKWRGPNRNLSFPRRSVESMLVCRDARGSRSMRIAHFPPPWRSGESMLEHALGKRASKSERWAHAPRGRRLRRRATAVECHTPPRGALMPRRFSSSAMARTLEMPDDLMPSMRPPATALPPAVIRKKKPRTMPGPSRMKINSAPRPARLSRRSR